MHPMEVTLPTWEEAERWARALVAIAGALATAWAVVRWPLAVLLRALALAALRAALADDDLRRAVGALLRERSRDDVPAPRRP